MKTRKIISYGEWVKFVDTLCFILKKYKVSTEDIDSLAPSIEHIALGIDLLEYLWDKFNE